MIKSILVTGGCGFIGSHTCLNLLENNFNIVVLDSNINSNSISLKKILEIGLLNNHDFSQKLSFYKGDIRDFNLLDRIFFESIKNKSPIEAVVHFAGLKAVEESFKDPLLYWDNNLNGSLTLFRAMQKYDCKNIVFSSSATVYGNSSLKLISEKVKLKPTNVYGKTKLAVEQLLKDLFLSSDKSWRIANLRYFNPIGAHHSGLIGENPLNIPNNLFPYICGVASGKFKNLNIYGNNWDTEDGTCVRDFIHVMDLAEAHSATLFYLFKNNPIVLNLNIGTGKGTSVIELMNTFKEINKCNIPFKFVDRRQGDVSYLVADNSLALSTIQWKPKRNLEKMCLDGWRWQKNNPQGYL